MTFGADYRTAPNHAAQNEWCLRSDLYILRQYSCEMEILEILFCFFNDLFFKLTVGILFS